jgi:hypothetical protein
MGQRGVYSIFSAFFLIVLVVAVVIFMVMMGAQSSIMSAQLSGRTTHMQEANQIKDNIYSCWGTFDTNAINNALFNKCMNTRINGYSIDVIDFLGCTPLHKEFGSASTCIEKIPFTTSILSDSGNKCLGKLTLCFGK